MALRFRFWIVLIFFFLGDFTFIAAIVFLLFFLCFLAFFKIIETVVANVVGSTIFASNKPWILSRDPVPAALALDDIGVVLFECVLLEWRITLSSCLSINSPVNCIASIFILADLSTFLFGVVLLGIVALPLLSFVSVSLIISILMLVFSNLTIAWVY